MMTEVRNNLIKKILFYSDDSERESLEKMEIEILIDKCIILEMLENEKNG